MRGESCVVSGSSNSLRAHSLAGVDGCKAGWFAVLLDIETGEISSEVFRSAKELCGALADAAVIAVDVPVGLTDRGQRECDREARKRLGRPRASSVFPAPIRAALGARTRKQASAVQLRLDGRGIGVQVWNILPKIREWDSFLRSNPAMARRVFEVHPELSFWALNGFRPMKHNKKTLEGRRQRREVLVKEFGSAVLDEVRSSRTPREVADDDLHDAFAALWTARRIYAGAASRLPETAPRDSTGLPMAIWY